MSLSFRSVAWFAEMVSNRFDEDNTALADYMMMIGNELVHELLTNAIEHGSSWCRSGEMVMRAAQSKDAVFVVTDQPLRGISADKIALLLDVADGRQFEKALLTNENGQVRGHGLRCVADPKYPDVNFVELECGGFRSLILATSEMAEKRYRSR